MATDEQDPLTHAQRIYLLQRLAKQDKKRPNQDHVHIIPSHIHNPPVEFQTIDPINPHNHWDHTNNPNYIQMDPIAKIRWHPDTQCFEVIGHNRTLVISQQKIVDLAMGVARDDRELRDSCLERDELATCFAQLKEDVLSLVECCDDETCEKNNLCDKCIMIKGWAS